MRTLGRFAQIILILYLFHSCRNGLTDNENSTADGIGPNSTINLSLSSGYVTGNLPQDSPTVSWVINSGEFIASYEIALGSEPGTANIVNWTPTTNMTNHVFANYNFTECQRYYPSIRSLDITGALIETLAHPTGFTYDNTPPTLSIPDVSADDATFDTSPTTTWVATTDNCSGSNIYYEYAIGTSAGGTDIVDFINIGNVNTYNAQAGVDDVSESLLFITGIQYWSTVRVYDEAGLFTEQTHSGYGPWYFGFDPSDLPNMVAWVDSNNNPSVIDSNGRDADDPLFNNSVNQMRDVSGSVNVHNFSPAFGAGSRPTYDPVKKSLSFDGASQCLTAANHPDLNTATVNQRNLSVVFETSNDTSSRQVIYEEGGNVRGMNVYLFNDRIYCGFYNTPNDGDGAQPFVSVSAPVGQNTKYVVAWVFDYTNYAGAGPPDGTLSCYLNGTQIGATIPSTSRLFAHSGNIGLGCKNNTSYYEVGGASTGNGHYFQGDIMELMLFNDPPNATTVNDIYQYLRGKWSFP